MGYRTLNEEEQRVILHKGTEYPFTGKYDKFYEDGVYSCKQCGESLFDSSSKFNSGSGWPSFDDAIDGKVSEVPDKDGRRVEIVCSNCGGHLGHVFRGEGFTDKNARFCVNSVSLIHNSKS
jgi:methionine-R-sulfoxide reductase